MSFRAQMIGGQVASLLLTLALGVFAVVALGVTTRSASNITREVNEDVGIVQQVRLQSEQLVATSRAYLLTGDLEYITRFERIQGAFARSLEQLQARAIASEQSIATLERHARDYVAAVIRAAGMRTTAGDPSAILVTFERELKPLRDVFEGDVEAFVREQKVEAAAALERVRTRSSQAQLVLILVMVLSVALSTALGVVVMRKLGREYQRAKQAEAVAAEASEARKQLLAVVSHDLRAPLNTIVLGAAQLDELGLPERRYVELISAAAERMTHLIAELVDVARIEGGALALAYERVEVRELLELTERMFRSQAEAKEIELRLECEVATVVADRERVLRVLSNLVGNALKFATPGSALVISARETAEGVHFDVADSGPGIRAEDVSHLFERGWQAGASKHRGLGLGLYICKALVEAHHGRIGVDSTVGVGSRFWFELPRTRAASS